MIVGRIKENEKTVRMDVDIRCTDCGKSVPGGIKASEEFSKSGEFQSEIDRLKEDYLCGVCRDRKRVGAS